jgi:hypothetical protein
VAAKRIGILARARAAETTEAFASHDRITLDHQLVSMTPEVVRAAATMVAPNGTGPQIQH